MTVQWADGLSPAEKASTLEAEVAELKAQLARYATGEAEQ
jgi:hypothetical protein